MSTVTYFRLEVLKRLTTCLATGGTGDGYFYDLTGAVFRGRSAYGDNDPLPMLSIVEDPRNLEQDMAPNGAPASTGDWCLLIQGFVEDDGAADPTDAAYLLLCDVKKKLARAAAQRASRDILGFGYRKPSIDSIRLGAGVVRPPDEISAKAYFWLPVTLTLVEDHENPFTLP